MMLIYDCFFSSLVAHKIDKSNFNVVCLLDGWTEKLPGRSGRILSMWGINHISMCVFLGKMVAKKKKNFVDQLSVVEPPMCKTPNGIIFTKWG